MYLSKPLFCTTLLFVGLGFAQINSSKQVESKGKQNHKKRNWVSLGVHLGVQFNSLQQRPRLSDYSTDYRANQKEKDDLQVTEYNSNQERSDTAKTSSSRVLQAYQPVDITVPFGLFLYIKTFSFLDLLISTQSFWHEQTEIIEYKGLSFSNSSGITGGSVQNIPLKYGLQAHMGGIGGRFHIPIDFISVRGSKPIVVQIQKLWHLWGSEIYTSHGVLPAQFESSGNGWEFSTGYPWRKFGPVQITTYLSYFTATFSSSQTWSQLSPFSQEKEYLNQNSWVVNGIKLQFQLQYIP